MTMQPSEPIYQIDSLCSRSSATILRVQPFSTLPSALASLFPFLPDPPPTKPSNEQETPETWYLVTADSTIFHPQAGGQPSDTGTMTTGAQGWGDAEFHVTHVRHTPEGIRHSGWFFNLYFPLDAWMDGDLRVAQNLCVQRRELHSRLHTAGHVLGLAVCTPAGTLGPVHERKAQYYPDAAFVTFEGLIGEEHRATIQAMVDEILARNAPVNVHRWSEAEVMAKCAGVPETLERDGQGNIRVVEIERVGSYPCGGTHLPKTGDIGTVELTSIKQQDGMTRISYRIGQTQRTSKRSDEARDIDRKALPYLEFQASFNYVKEYFQPQ